METVEILNTQTDKLLSMNLQPSLRECLEQHLTRYFDQLGDNATCSLYNMVIEAVEEPLIKMALQRCDKNQTKAAELLGISRGTLRKKIALYQIN